MYSKQEKAMDALKVSSYEWWTPACMYGVDIQDKLVDRLVKTGNTSGDQVIQEHLLYNKQLMESMDRSETPHYQLPFNNYIS